MLKIHVNIAQCLAADKALKTVKVLLSSPVTQLVFYKTIEIFQKMIDFWINENQ